MSRLVVRSLGRFFHARVWHEMHGHPGGDTGVDNEIAKQGFEHIGAWILGRNMFGPIRGRWSGDEWKRLVGR